jgi:hypothetical protein
LVGTLFKMSAAVFDAFINKFTGKVQQLNILLTISIKVRFFSATPFC